VEFSPGLNVIVGPNGSGKSNIVNGVYGALTGDFGRNAGKTSDNVSLMSKEGEKTLVQVEFVHNGETYVIERRLDVAERRLVTSGQTLTVDKDVLERIYNILGVRKEILSNYVFVEQWDNFGPIVQTPTKRFDSLRKLFKIDQIDSIISELSNSDYKLYSTADALINVDEQVTKLNGLKDQALSIQETLAACETVESLEAKISEQATITNAWKIKKALEISIANRKQELKLYEEKLNTNRESANSFLKEIEDLNKSLAELKESLETANQIEADWVRFNFYTISKQQLDSKLKALKAESDSSLEPVKPATYVEDIETLTAQLSEMKLRHSKCLDFVSNYNFESADAVCPTCQQPAPHLASQWHDQKEKLKQLAETISQVSKQIADNALFDRAAYNYSVWKKNFDSRMTDLSESYARLKVEEQPQYSREEAKKITNLHKSLSGGLLKASTAFNAVNIEWSSLNAKTESLVKEIAREDNELVKYSGITDTAVEDANAVIDRLRQQKNAINTLITQLAVVNNEIKAVNANIALAEAHMRQTEKFGAWNNRFEDLKRVYKTNKEKSIPMIITRQYMGAVIDELNRTLSNIDMPFTINLLSDLSFQADFGTHKVPSDRLSGGQKVMLTMAYRLAVNSTFAADLGLLCLDEPTVGLDEANLVGLSKAFEGLKEYALNAGTQIVVVTHEKGLSHLFDNTIDLS
jgi:DNA repair exonuclease SbcCD ATPase subunit